MTKRVITSILLILCSLPLFGVDTSKFPAEHSPQIFVIFGATGDLTKRKLLPALTQLAKNEKLPKQFLCIGVGRRELSQVQFLEEISSFVSQKDPELWEKLKDKIVYLQGPFEKPETYEKISHLIKEFNLKWKAQANQLYYLATPQSSFDTIVKHLHHQNLLAEKEGSYSRILIEKPFGRDVSSAVQLQKQLSLHLNPEQVYLIDHYLGKEMVRNLLSLRFDNPLFESLWNREHIDHVSITVSEDLGIETRGTFWEETGLLRDMIQSHLMQLVCLTAMEKPKSHAEADIRKEKVRLMQSIRPFPDEKLDQYIIRGQYDEGVVNGTKVLAYRQEKGVAKDSGQETFIAAKLFIDSPRWSQVPFYIKVGKRLSGKFAEIALTFKSPKGDSPNQLILRIQPQEEVIFVVNMPTLDHSKIQTQRLSLNLREKYGNEIPDAYERLLYDAMLGDHSHFVSFEEHLISWRLFSPILQRWQQNPPRNFPNYESGSEGPDISALY